MCPVSRFSTSAKKKSQIVPKTPPQNLEKIVEVCVRRSRGFEFEWVNKQETPQLSAEELSKLKRLPKSI